MVLWVMEAAAAEPVLGSAWVGVRPGRLGRLRTDWMCRVREIGVGTVGVLVRVGQGLWWF